MSDVHWRLFSHCGNTKQASGYFCVSENQQERQSGMNKSCYHGVVATAIHIFKLPRFAAGCGNKREESRKRQIGSLREAAGLNSVFQTTMPPNKSIDKYFKSSFSFFLFQNIFFGAFTKLPLSFNQKNPETLALLASTSLFFSVFQHHAMLVCFLSPFPPFLPLYASTHEVLEIFGQRESGMDVRLICDSGRRTKTRAEVKELLRLFLPHRSLRMVISLRSTAPE